MKGHGSGEGWYLAAVRPGAFTRATNVLFGLVGVYLVGKLALTGKFGAAGAVLFVTMAIVLVQLFSKPPRNPLPPVIHDEGMLLPAARIPLGAVLALAAMGPVLLVTVGLFIIEGALERATNWWPHVGLGGATLLGLLLVAGVLGAIRQRARNDRGLLLTQQVLVLRTQQQPVEVPWDALLKLRPHWRSRGQRSIGSLQVSNYLSFEATEHRGESVISALAGTQFPTVDVDWLSVDPDAMLALLHFYWTHRDARVELGTQAALDRYAALQRSPTG